jgi:hypothetical protein
MQNPSRLNGEQKQLIGPQKLHEKNFGQLHRQRTSGHFGIERATDLIKLRFYWPDMDKCIKRGCTHCDICAKCKPCPGFGKSLLNQLVATAPMQCGVVDILGPLPITQNGNEYIIVFGNYKVDRGLSCSEPYSSNRC